MNKKKKKAKKKKSQRIIPHKSVVRNDKKRKEKNHLYSYIKPLTTTRNNISIYFIFTEHFRVS